MAWLDGIQKQNDAQAAVPSKIDAQAAVPIRQPSSTRDQNDEDSESGHDILPPSKKRCRAGTAVCDPTAASRGAHQPLASITGDIDEETSAPTHTPHAPVSVFGNLVDDTIIFKLRAKIMVNQFVELADLLPHSSRQKAEEYALRPTPVTTQVRLSTISPSRPYPYCSGWKPLIISWLCTSTDLRSRGTVCFWQSPWWRTRGTSWKAGKWTMTDMHMIGTSNWIWKCNPSPILPIGMDCWSNTSPSQNPPDSFFRGNTQGKARDQDLRRKEEPANCEREYIPVGFACPTT